MRRRCSIRCGIQRVSGALGVLVPRETAGPSVASITPHETSAGKRYRVRYPKPDHSQTDKRGLRTKREAKMFLASVEVAKHTGRYIDPSRSRVTIGTWMTAWIDSRSDLRASTLDRVQGVIRNHIVLGLGAIAVADLGRLQAQQWASRLKLPKQVKSHKKFLTHKQVAELAAAVEPRSRVHPRSAGRARREQGWRRTRVRQLQGRRGTAQPNLQTRLVQ